METGTHQSASACLELPKNAVEIIEFQPELRNAFKSLNVEWISKYFALEAEDERILDNPETEILAPGGAILFARLPENGKIVGTCALIKMDAEHYELGKMAVTEQARGRKIGKKLLEATIAKARSLNATYMTLETNSSLTPAINLYKSLGFIQQPFKEESPYARADVYMRLNL
jgi:ribosomal protein S18 acetylase RimI-like enzyme